MMSALLLHRFLSFSALQNAEPVQDAIYDLITFLAVIQKLEINILPITWQSARQPIAFGGTSLINEALINLQTSFVFKCVSDEQKASTTEERIYQTIIDEIAILGHPTIRRHPNIVDLQGICWDVGNYHIWPVLVFEKTHLGDMFTFLTSPLGRNLGTGDRLKLCVDIAVALRDMHAIGTNDECLTDLDLLLLGIIHGDVKPENALIFRRDDGSYVARVTDFGYSSRFANKDDNISMPKTEPWVAPEHQTRCTPGQAWSMDIFSFGMLCLWVICEKYLSAMVSLPEEGTWAKDYQHYLLDGNKCAILQFLGHLKRDNKLIPFAQHVIAADDDLTAEEAKTIWRFLNSSLIDDPHLRGNNLEEFLVSLIPDR
jgi:serine/threonine protein kinase